MPSKREALTVTVIMALFLLLTSIFIGLRSEHPKRIYATGDHLRFGDSNQYRRQRWRRDCATVCE